MQPTDVSQFQQSLWVFLIVIMNRLLNEPSGCLWFETWWLMWLSCNGIFLITRGFQRHKNKTFSKPVITYRCVRLYSVNDIKVKIFGPKESAIYNAKLVILHLNKNYNHTWLISNLLFSRAESWVSINSCNISSLLRYQAISLTNNDIFVTGTLEQTSMKFGPIYKIFPSQKSEFERSTK